MTSSPAQTGSQCEECRKVGRYSEARRTITDGASRRHLCANHAAAVIHSQNLYDFTMNPTGKK
jgi:hypothetical protein